MNLIKFALIVAAFLGTALSSCPSGWVSSPFGTCYLFGYQRVTWGQADNICRSKGANLATLDSLAEINLIKGTRHTQVFNGLADRHMWVGGKKENGRWVWKTPFVSTSIIHTDWRQNEPNNSGGGEDCLELYEVKAYGGAWNDISCSTPNDGYICEKNADGVFGR